MIAPDDLTLFRYRRDGGRGARRDRRLGRALLRRQSSGSRSQSSAKLTRSQPAKRAMRSSSASSRARRPGPKRDATLWPEGAHGQHPFVAPGLHVDPAHDPVALQQGKDVVAVAPLRLGHEDLDPVEEAEQPLGTVPVAQRRVEGRKDAQSARRLRRGRRAVKDVGPGEAMAVAAIGSFDRDLDQRRLRPSPPCTNRAPPAASPHPNRRRDRPASRSPAGPAPRSRPSRRQPHAAGRAFCAPRGSRARSGHRPCGSPRAA